MRPREIKALREVLARLNPNDPLPSFEQMGYRNRAASAKGRRKGFRKWLRGLSEEQLQKLLTPGPPPCLCHKMAGFRNCPRHRKP